MAETASDAVDELVAKAMEIKAENARLRAALETAAWQLEEVAAPHMRECVPGALAIQSGIKAKIARAALNLHQPERNDG